MKEVVLGEVKGPAQGHKTAGGQSWLDSPASRFPPAPKCPQGLCQRQHISVFAIAEEKCVPFIYQQGKPHF